MFFKSASWVVFIHSFSNRVNEKLVSEYICARGRYFTPKWAPAEAYLSPKIAPACHLAFQATAWFTGWVSRSAVATDFPLFSFTIPCFFLYPCGQFQVEEEASLIHMLGLFTGYLLRLMYLCSASSLLFLSFSTCLLIDHYYSRLTQA